MYKKQKIIPNKWYNINDLVKLSQESNFPCKSKVHIRRLLEAGKLKGIDIGVRSLKQWRIEGKSVINFISGEDKNND